MKTPKDPRHRKREKKIQLLYQYSFQAKKAVAKNIVPIIKHLSQIDAFITRAAPEWPVEKLNKIDLAILRLSVYELKLEKKIPPKVVIDEAVELAKKYGAEKSAKFVNGALGALFQSEEGIKAKK